MTALAGRTLVVAALGTGEARVAKINAAKILVTLYSIIKKMRLRMVREFNINISDLGNADPPAISAFALGQEFEATKAELQREFAMRLRALLASERDDFDTAPSDLIHGRIGSDFPSGLLKTHMAEAATVARLHESKVAAVADTALNGYAARHGDSLVGPPCARLYAQQTGRDVKVHLKLQSGV